LLAKTGPDEDNPQRIAIDGTFHMLRHFFVTALIQSGCNMKIAQTLAGHHSAAFTLDQYADAARSNVSVHRIMLVQTAVSQIVDIGER
jgi:integrase